MCRPCSRCKAEIDELGLVNDLCHGCRQDYRRQQTWSRIAPPKNGVRDGIHTPRMSLKLPRTSNYAPRGRMGHWRPTPLDLVAARVIVDALFPNYEEMPL